MSDKPFSEQPPNSKEQRSSTLDTVDSRKVKNIKPRSKVERPAEELRQIEDIRRELLNESGQVQPSEAQETSVAWSQIEAVVINGKKYTVEYVPKEEIYPAFGYGGGNAAVVRQDLSPRVKRFVREHELYHCQDKAMWGGWLGREIRANFIPGLKDPIGLAATVWATISDIGRIRFYLRRIKENK
ncbi:MAG: hypothetical protein WAV15_00610 [Minisyncoccia bacterium]